MTDMVGYASDPQGPPVPAWDVFSVPAGAGGQVFNGAARLYGWSWRETSGAAPAQVDIYNGANAAGELIASISLSAGQSTRDWLGWPGLRCNQRVFVAVVAGAVTGSIWLASEQG